MTIDTKRKISEFRRLLDLTMWKYDDQIGIEMDEEQERIELEQTIIRYLQE